MEVQKDVSIEKQSDRKKWIRAVVCMLIALISFFAISKWATSVDTYSGVMETLNNLQKKALKLTGTSTALATGAAAVPGDATTPIANKLADMAGYMVIVYIAIIVEKYLLTLTGFVTFKLLLPIGFALGAAGSFFQTEWMRFLYRIAVKCIVLGVLLWCLVPTSVWVTNRINDTYDNSQNIDVSLLEENENVEIEEEKVEDENENEQKEDGKFSINKWLTDFKNQVSDVVEDTGKIATDKLKEFENALNQMIESVAVMIVTTCVIPILVLMAFIWILKMVTGLNLPMSTVQSLPKGSKIMENMSARKKIKE